MSVWLCTTGTASRGSPCLPGSHVAALQSAGSGPVHAEHDPNTTEGGSNAAKPTFAHAWQPGSSATADAEYEWKPAEQMAAKQPAALPSVQWEQEPSLT